MPPLRVALLLLSAALLAGCGSAARPTLRVTPALSSEDQPVRIAVSGLRGGERVTLTLRSTDAAGYPFVSHASYTASANGTLDLPHPLLLPAMKATRGSPQAYYDWGVGDAAHRFELTATAGGRTAAKTSFERHWSAVPLTSRTLTPARDGLDGVFISPARARHRGAVLVFGGSEGGVYCSYARAFAAEGLPTLCVGYFHAPGLPDRLVDIPLEYFAKALRWLARQPQVDPARVSVYSGSYGSEAALLLGVHFPRLVHRIVATVPSSVVTCGIMGAGRVPPSGNPCLGSPWTLDGKPLPHTALLDDPHPSDAPAAVIPVARIRAPLLLACAGADQEWASCTYASAIVAERKGEPTRLYQYPRAGHYVGAAELAYAPGGMQSDLFPPWEERGREDLWPRVAAFLRG